MGMIGAALTGMTFDVRGPRPSCNKEAGIEASTGRVTEGLAESVSLRYTVMSKLAEGGEVRATSNESFAFRRVRLRSINDG